MRTVTLSGMGVGNPVASDPRGEPLYTDVEGKMVDKYGNLYSGLLKMNNGRQVVFQDGKYYREATASELIGDQKTGTEEGVTHKESVSTMKSDCPCEVKKIPYNLYLSKMQTAGSVPIRATQNKVVCQTPPSQSPDVPCDELQRALSQMNQSSSLEGITSSVIDTVKYRPIGSAIELGAGIMAGVYADRQFNTPTWATVGIAVIAGMIAGKITDSIGV